MKRVAIANTGIAVSRISFGTASLHHLFNARERAALLGAAFETGVTHFDSSPYYGYGVAEASLGFFALGRRSEVTVTTKVGLYPFGSASASATAAWARKAAGRFVPRISLPQVNWTVRRAQLSLRESLRRLRTSYVDFLLLHEPESTLLDADEFLRWLQSEQRAGTVRAWGLAGTRAKVEAVLESAPELAVVVQTRDSLKANEANFLLARERPLQFTYGYLSSAKHSDAASVLRQALARNSTGSVIVSTRRVQRVAQIVEAAL